MLSDHERELLTAYLDGQLGARQRKAAQRLLHRSSAARELLRQLQEDAHALRGLPRHALPADFAAQVLRVAAERGLRPGGTRPAPRPQGIPTWAGLAAAAAVLLAVTTGSYLYFSGTQPVPEGERVARPNFAVPEAGYRFALRDLRDGGLRPRLEQELRHDPAWHLDLATADTSQALGRLAEAFRKQGAHLLVEQRARVSLKKQQPKTTYVVYAENLRPEELTAILAQAGHVGRVESVLLNPMSAQDRGRLAKMFGVSVASLEPIRGPKFPLLIPFEGPDRDKGKGDNKAGPAPREAGGYAVVLSQAGTRNLSEIRQFLNSHRAYRPGTVQVYLVLHEASA